MGAFPRSCPSEGTGPESGRRCVKALLRVLWLKSRGALGRTGSCSPDSPGRAQGRLLWDRAAHTTV